MIWEGIQFLIYHTGYLQISVRKNNTDHETLIPNGVITYTEEGVVISDTDRMFILTE